MDLDTSLKKIQLFTAFFCVCLGFFTDFIPFSTAFVFYVSFFAAAFYIAFAFFRSPKKMISQNRTNLLLLVTLFIGILANPEYSDVYSIVMLMELVMYLFASMCYTGRENMEEIGKWINMLFRVITVILFVLTSFTLLNGLFGTHYAGLLPRFLQVYPAEQYEQWHYELLHFCTGGLYHNGNQLALNAYISGMLSMYFLREKKSGLLFDKVNLVIQLAGIAVSSCRSILIAVVFTAAYLVYHSGIKNGKKIMKAILLVSFLIMAVMTRNKLHYYFVEDGLGELIQKLTGNRFLIWEECFSLFKHKPVFGVGLNNIQKAAVDLIGKKSVMRYRNYNNAHNIVINILSMTGLTGAVMFTFAGRDILHGLKRCGKYLVIMSAGLLFGDCLDIFVLFTNKLPSFLLPAIAGLGIRKMLAEPKHICFFTNAVEEDTYRKIFTKSVRPGQQSQKFNRLIAEGFKLNGNKVTCCTAVPVSAAIADYLIKKIKDHDIYHYSLSINIPGIKNIWNALAAFFYVMFAENAAVAVDTLSIDNAAGALLASKLRGFRSTGIVTDLPEHFSGDQTFSKIVYWIIRRCDSYVFLTKYMDERLNPKHKPWIVMEGLCDAQTVPEQAGERTRSMIFAGEIDPENGVLNLADAFLAWGYHGYDLYFYGNGKAMDTLKEKTKDDPHVHIMGLILNRELVEIMKNASLLLNPRPVHQDFVKYSFPSKVMEYMHTGTYHASTRLACIPDEYFNYIGDLGDGSPEDILKFLKAFENMPAGEMEEKGRQAQSFVLAEKNNRKQAGRIAELLEGLYEQ
ncbi:MAG: O-antigen ligase family protein [Solobacterium sp.]|nr:O-antigen ligase family protein [Solobacterium sp.]